MDRRLRCYSLMACALSFWLAALSPLPQKIKVLIYVMALGSGLQLVSESKKLIIDEARATALWAMQQELEQTEIALHSYNQEQQLTQMYTAPTYTEEVHQELTESLEHLYSEPSADHPAETSASTSTTKSLYLSICKLLELTNETFIIENVLRMGGRTWAEGKQRLKEILDEGKRNEW